MDQIMFHRLILAVVLMSAVGAATADSLDKAKEIFAKYSSLEAAFNPAVADLYSDQAIIKNKRTYPTGQVREMALPAPQYKTLIRSAMPLAKAKGDYSTYTYVSYSQEGQNVRVKATRFSVLKQYLSRLSLLIGPNEQEQWLILEEISESQP